MTGRPNKEYLEKEIGELALGVLSRACCNFKTDTVQAKIVGIPHTYGTAIQATMYKGYMLTIMRLLRARGLVDSNKVKNTNYWFLTSKGREYIRNKSNPGRVISLTK